MAEEEKQATYEELSTWLQEWQDKYVDLVWRHREVSERLDSIEGVYARLYKKWWIRWFFTSWDPVLEGKKLMRCSTCGGLFFLGGEKEFTSHLGHKYSTCKEYRLLEHIRLLAGRVK